VSGARLPGLARAVLVPLLLVTPAAAHTELVRALPAARAAVEVSPHRVELWFTERLDAGRATVSVWSSAGARVDKQDVLVGPDDLRRLSVGLYTLRPGAYTVHYRVQASDGHVLDSRFVFTVGIRSAP
jgi:methionine-rich copper-binding protein CopC